VARTLTAVLDTVASVVPPPSTFVVYPYPRIMSREEAEAEAGRLSAEHPNEIVTTGSRVNATATGRW